MYTDHKQLITCKLFSNRFPV